jgi:hypothetical protein
MDAGRRNRLEIGDFLNAASWASDQATLGHYCERIGLSLRSAREYMQTAAAADELLRQAIERSGVHVSYSVVREGGLFGADPGFKVCTDSPTSSC